MKAIALQKSYDHLEVAKAAALELNLKKGFKPYERAWSQLLSQASRIYGKLEQGSKGCNVSEPWFGQKKNERKSDQLLAYMHHARNSDEHGLDYITQRGADGLSLGFPATKEVRFGMDFMIDDKGKMHVRNPTVESPNGGINSVEILNPRVELIPVKDRGVTYNPPNTHAGQPIADADPRALGLLVIEHLEHLLEEAASLPAH